MLGSDDVNDSEGGWSALSRGEITSLQRSSFANFAHKNESPLYQGMAVMDAVSNADIIYIIILYRVDEGGQRGIIDRNRERQNGKLIID